MKYCKNYDIESVVMPVNVQMLHKLLWESEYLEAKMQKLVEWFTNGFDIGYRGNTNVKREANNLKLHVGNELILWNKVMKEVEVGRFYGPFRTVPYDNYIQ